MLVLIATLVGLLRDNFGDSPPVGGGHEVHTEWLIQWNEEWSEYVPNLAESWDVENDGTGHFTDRSFNGPLPKFTLVRPSGIAIADYNGDGTVDVSDLLLQLANWG
jgi:hypothetical protein